MTLTEIEAMVSGVLCQSYCIGTGSLAELEPGNQKVSSISPSPPHTTTLPHWGYRPV